MQLTYVTSIETANSALIALVGRAKSARLLAGVVLYQVKLDALYAPQYNSFKECLAGQLQQVAAILGDSADGEEFATAAEMLARAGGFVLRLWRTGRYELKGVLLQIVLPGMLYVPTRRMEHRWLQHLHIHRSQPARLPHRLPIMACRHTRPCQQRERLESQEAHILQGRLGRWQ